MADARGKRLSSRKFFLNRLLPDFRHLSPASERNFKPFALALHPTIKGWGVIMLRRNLRALAGSVLLVAATAPAFAGTAPKHGLGHDQLFAPVYGKTLAPIGFVEFCARNKSQCEPVGSSARATLTKAAWERLRKVNVDVNSSIEPVSDQDLYAVPERWEYPVDAGDCEDYVLLKKRLLQNLGFPKESLLIAVVLDEASEGHAVLMVTTDLGDFVLDNRRNEILRWSDTRYRFLKRQSQEDPRTWMALSEAGKTSVVEAAAGEANE
jgi:predicted transglutaminase-like cysteine proteinase